MDAKNAQRFGYTSPPQCVRPETFLNCQISAKGLINPETKRCSSGKLRELSNVTVNYALWLGVIPFSQLYYSRPGSHLNYHRHVHSANTIISRAQFGLWHRKRKHGPFYSNDHLHFKSERMLNGMILVVSDNRKIDVRPALLWNYQGRLRTSKS